MISQDSITAMGKAMASDFIEYMECDPELYSLLIVKVEQFMVENGIQMSDDLEADLCQCILENVSLTN